MKDTLFDSHYILDWIGNESLFLFCGWTCQVTISFYLLFFLGGGLNCTVIRKYRNAHALQCDHSKARVTHC